MNKLFSYWREIVIAIFGFYILGKAINNEPEKEIIVDEQVEIIENKWTGFDALTFDEAFSQMYTMYGDGHVFDWRGKVFLTKLAE
tara:strand:+ start:385 stop:639 length:255 start_codon:yes stop_codon:yes gene_type:complete